MTFLPGRLGTLVAHDVMTRDVVTVSDSDRLNKAVKTLRQQHISGVPVVNAEGKLVGILALSDLVDLDQPAVSTPDSLPEELAHGGGDASWALFERATPVSEKPPEGTVADRMSKQVTSISGEAPLVEVARVMCDGHWHRVPVVDQDGSLVGIISTMDILASIVNAADEAG